MMFDYDPFKSRDEQEERLSIWYDSKYDHVNDDLLKELKKELNDEKNDKKLEIVWFIFELIVFFLLTFCASFGLSLLIWSYINVKG